MPGRHVMIGDSHLARRQEQFQRVRHRLETLSEAGVVDLLGQGVVLGSGIGGTRSRVTVDGYPVFAKRVPLTDLEKLPENIGSTVNLFNLP
ncbi:MAG: hypothetical protein GY708_23620 [Actinomycetia bacterium]|nr:hypothetical protein [Actinomycetes bacterium]MCP4967978.1 hypothetical protein [bacterium]